MSTNHLFLLICVKGKSLWLQKVRRSLFRLGKLEVTSQQQVLQAIQKKKYDLIIIDAAATDDEVLLTSKIRTLQPQARIVIVTASPTWRRAREAFRAGAIDYISKTQTENELFSIAQNILSMTPPSQLRTP